MKRRYLLLLILVVLALAAVLAVCYWPPLHLSITKESVNRIKLGMTRADVEAILGPPRNDEDKYIGDRSGVFSVLIEFDPHSSPVTNLCWASNEAEIGAGFNQDGILVEIRQYPDRLVRRETRWQAFMRQMKAVASWK